MSAPELQFTTEADLDITTISWTSVERTDESTTLRYRIWNELDPALVPDNADTATNVAMYPVYQMNVGEPYLASGVEPADQQWLNIRAVVPTIGSPTINPDSLSGYDYHEWTSGWYSIGGQARFVWGANFPRRYARTFEMFLYPPGSGATTSVNSMKVVLDWQRGVLTMGPFEQSREGDMTVARGDGGRYEIIRSRKMQGCRVVPMISVSSMDEFVIEQSTFHLGKFGISPVATTIIKIPAVETDGDGVALAGGESYVILVTKDPTGTGFTATKGSKAAANPVTPVSPTSNHIPIAAVTKTTGTLIGAAAIENYMHHGWGMLHWDNAGADVYVNDYLNEQGGAVQWRDAPVLQTLAAAANSFAKVNGQNVVTANATAPTQGEIYLGTVVTAVGNVTEISQRQWYNGRSSYLSRKRSVVEVWNLQDAEYLYTSALGMRAFMFGDLYRIGYGTVDNTPTTITSYYPVGGRKVAIHPHAAPVPVPGVLRVTGTKWDLQGTEVPNTTEDMVFGAADEWMITDNRWLGTGVNENGVEVSGLGRGPITVTVAVIPAAGDTLTINIDGASTTYTFNVDIPIMGTVQLQAAQIAASVTAAGLPAGVIATNQAPSDLVQIEMGTTNDYIIVTTSVPAKLVIAEVNPSPDVDCDVYAMELWDNCGKPFHVGTLKIKFITMTDSATLNLRLMKFSPLSAGPYAGGLQTIYSLTGLGAMPGYTGGAADSVINGHAFQIVLNERNATGALCDRYDRWNAPMQAMVDPWRGEGIFLELFDMQDISMVRAELQYYDLFA